MIIVYFIIQLDQYILDEILLNSSKKQLKQYT